MPEMNSGKCRRSGTEIGEDKAFRGHLDKARHILVSVRYYLFHPAGTIEL